MKVPANAASIQSIQISIAITAILIFYGVNLVGLKMSAKTQNILMVIKIHPDPPVDRAIYFFQRLQPPRSVLPRAEPPSRNTSGPLDSG
jgi:hypothetical protein